MKKGDVKVTDFLGLTDEGKRLIEESDWYVVDISENVQYDDKGKRTDTILGSKYILSGAITAAKGIRNKQLYVKSDVLWTQDEIDELVDSDDPVPVRLKLTKIVPYVGGSGNYRTIELSLTGDLYDVNGEKLNDD